MSGGSHRSPDLSEVDPTPTYVAECYWPQVTEELAKTTFRRIAAAAARQGSREAQPLGCILVPTDGMVLVLFRAPNEEWVKNQSSLSEVPFDRIVESIQIGLHDEPD